MEQNKKPAWKIEETITSGTEAHELATRFKPELEPRLGAGVIDGLGADTQELRGNASDAASTRVGAKAATLDEGTALRNGALIVAAVRATIRRTFAADKAIQRSFGVGAPVNANSIGSVAAGLRIVLSAADKNPEAAREAGILPADLDDARTALAALVTADQDQAGHKLTAKQATARRAATQLRVEAAVLKIVGVATLAFRNRPDVLAQFAAVIPSRSHRTTVASPSSPATATPSSKS